MPLTVFYGARDRTRSHEIARDRTRSHEIMTVFDGASELRRIGPLRDLSKTCPRRVHDMSPAGEAELRKMAALAPSMRLLLRVAVDDSQARHRHLRVHTPGDTASGGGGAPAQRPLHGLASGGLARADAPEGLLHSSGRHFRETVRGHFGDSSGTVRGHFGHVSQAHFAFPFAFGRTSAQSCTSAHTSAVDDLERSASSQTSTRDDTRSAEIARDRTRGPEMTLLQAQCVLSNKYGARPAEAAALLDVAHGLGLTVDQIQPRSGRDLDEIWTRSSTVWA